MSGNPKNSVRQGGTAAAVRWSAASKYGSQLMQLAISLVLAKLLAPEHFGLLGMATVFVGFVKTCSNLGFRQSIIQRKTLDEKFLSTIFWTNLAFTSLVAAVLASFSPLVAWFYQQPQVQPVLMALSINFIIPAFSLLPGTILQRELRFKQVAIRELIGTLTGGIVAIAMALNGYGVWSLVASSISTSLAETILLNVCFPIRIKWCLDRNSLRQSLRFGLNLAGADIFNYAARHLDNLVVGVALGPAALGYYTFAYRFMLLSRDSFTQVVNRVLFPKLAHEQDNDVRLAKISLRACSAVAFLSFPVMMGLAILAEPFTVLIVGEKWLPAVPLLWVLAPLGALQSLWPMATYLLLAKGRTDILFRWAIASGLLLSLSFCIGVYWGLMGVAVAYAMMSLVIIPASFGLAYRYMTGLSLVTLGMTLLPYAVSTAIMSLASSLVYRTLTASFGMPIGFISAIAIGVVTYAILAATLPLPAAVDFLRLVGFRTWRLGRLGQASLVQDVESNAKHR